MTSNPANDEFTLTNLGKTLRVEISHLARVQKQDELIQLCPLDRDGRLFPDFKVQDDIAVSQGVVDDGVSVGDKIDQYSSTWH